MTPDATAHLSADELDSLLTATPIDRATSHIATCPRCQELAARDALLVARLAARPTWDPSPTFAGRVLADLAAGTVTTPTAAALPAGVGSDRSLAARRRVMVGGLLTGSLVVAGFVWAAIDPPAAQRLAGPAVQNVTNGLWLGLQALVANTTEQPWFGPLRDALASPARAVPVIGAGALGYVALLVGFRRLLTRSATDASW
jgi:hypothetical protein